MPELMLDAPCVLFALGRESMFLRSSRSCRPLRGLPYRSWLLRHNSHPSLLIETGIGPVRTQAALDWLFSTPLIDAVSYRPPLVLSAGFSGALQDDLRVGDVVIASEIADLEDNHWQATWPTQDQTCPGARRGRLLTTTRLIGDPAEKRRLGIQFEALAVDMETAIVARACQIHAVPFGCVRAISDDVSSTLSPHFVSLLANGRAAPLRLAAAVAASPWILPELWRLARHTRLAAKKLALAVLEGLPCPIAQATNI